MFPRLPYGWVWLMTYKYARFLRQILPSVLSSAWNMDVIAGALTAISDHEDSCTNDINHKHRVNYVPDGFLKSHAGLTLPLDLFLLVKQRNKPVCV